MEATSWVVYLDLDAFYLSCELTRRPELVGKPAIVAHDPKGGTGRGVVLSASYEARALGFRSAMPVKMAWELRDKVAWIEPDFGFYEGISAEVMEYLRGVSPLTRAFSIDEAAFPTPPQGVEEVRAVAKDLQISLKKRFSLPSSVGISTSIAVAKIASDKAKPGGIVVVPPFELEKFLSPLPVRKVPGIGPVSERALKTLGIVTVADVRLASLRALEKAVGPLATSLAAMSHGQTLEERWPDEAPPRSFSLMKTFDTDTEVESKVHEMMARLAGELGTSVQAHGKLFRTVTVRVRWGDMSSVQRSRTLPHPTQNPTLLGALSREILGTILSMGMGPGRGVRTLGLVVSDLRPSDPRQQTLTEPMG